MTAVLDYKTKPDRKPSPGGWEVKVNMWYEYEFACSYILFIKLSFIVNCFAFEQMSATVALRNIKGDIYLNV